jgi:hypothetical protein
MGDKRGKVDHMRGGSREYRHGYRLSFGLPVAAKTTTTATPLRSTERASVRASAARGRSSKGSANTHGSKRASRRAAATHGRRNKRPAYASGRRAEGSVATHRRSSERTSGKAAACGRRGERSGATSRRDSGTALKSSWLAG